MVRRLEDSAAKRALCPTPFFKLFMKAANDTRGVLVQSASIRLEDLQVDIKDWACNTSHVTWLHACDQATFNSVFISACKRCSY